MTDKEVCRYLELTDRWLFILTHSGVDWKPEFESEMRAIEAEIAELRVLVEQEHKQRENQKETKQIMNVKDVMAILEVSESKAYSILRELNKDLSERGFITISGKVPTTFFEEKYTAYILPGRERYERFGTCNFTQKDSWMGMVFGH